MKLGVVDITHPEWMPDLVPHIDRLGYSRYWTTEHHGPNQSGSPTLMAALAAGLSDRMRVGTAGVLMEARSSLSVVEDFRVLQLMFPGRIDLGMAGAPIMPPFREELLDGRPPMTPATYLEKASTVVRLVRGEADEQGSLHPNNVGPTCRGVPEIWICGSSVRSALMAAELGVSYSYHDYIARGARSTGNLDPIGPEVIGAYVSAFRSNPRQQEPQFNIAGYGACSTSKSKAAELWKGAFSGARTHPPPCHSNVSESTGQHATFCGSPEECLDQLEALSERYRTDEVMVECLIDNFEHRMHAFELLSDELAKRPKSIGAPVNAR